MYTTIIHPLRKMYNLSINEYCVLEAIGKLCNNIKYNGWCVLSIPKLASALDLSPDTVSRAYKKLEGAGLAIKRRDSFQDTAVRTSDEWNEWFMPEKAELLLGMKTTTNEIVGHVPMPSEDPAGSGSKLRGEVVANCGGGGSKLRYNTNKDTNKDIKDTNAHFEIFWNIYPKKLAKANALKAFSKITEPIDVLVAAIESQKKSEAWMKEGGKYVPYPATWLNGKRWTDEVSKEVDLSFYIKEYERMEMNSAAFVSKYGVELLKQIKS